MAARGRRIKFAFSASNNLAQKGTATSTLSSSAFSASNNEAEYEGAISGSKMCLAVGAKNILLKTDSQLVNVQLKGEFEVRGANMVKYV